MAGQRKPYNPNSKYGRKKLREQAQNTYNNLPPEEKSDWNATGIVIVIIIAIIIFAFAGMSGVAKWFSR
jgi:hypothetical protein